MAASRRSWQPDRAKPSGFEKVEAVGAKPLLREYGRGWRGRQLPDSSSGSAHMSMLARSWFFKAELATRVGDLPCSHFGVPHL